MERKRQNIVGIACRILRKKQGMTQSDFIARCQTMGLGISRESLAKIESGFRRVNDAEVALLARALKVSPAALLDVPVEMILLSARHSPELPELETGDLMAADGEE